MATLREQAKEFTRQGKIAHWYLKPSQMPLYDFIRKRRFSVILAHRRFGKTTTVFTHICQRAQTEKIIIRCGGVTQSKIAEIVTYILDEIYQYAPELRPSYSMYENVGRFIFPSTKSELYLFGNADSSQVDRSRGTKADIIYCDERAFWRFRPEHVLRSILMPQVDNVPRSQIILTSSAPDDLSHPFLDEVREAKAMGNLYIQSILDTVALGDISQEEHNNIIERCGGIESETYQREYLNSLIPTKSRLVIPEATNEDLFVGEQERPPYLDWYVCLDLGYKDKTFALFGYLDFKKARVIIEREYVANYQSTKEITDACKKIEEELQMKPFKRLADNELQQIADMNREHNYQIMPIVKRSKQSNQGFKDSIINALRVGISGARILISPKCEQLIAQLKYGIWNEARSDFERTDKLGHLDGISAIAYLFDNISWERNPFPLIDPSVNRFESYLPTDFEKPADHKALENALNPKVKKWLTNTSQKNQLMNFSPFSVKE